MNNTWNRIVYGLWAPIYDRGLERFFAPGRRRAHELLALSSGEKVLLLGVGTGVDLPLLPPGARAVGVDLSAPMLARARARLPLVGRTVELLQRDAQHPNVTPGSFDAVVLNLILSVVPDPGACFREALRALRPGGRMVVFDKFVPDGERARPWRRLANRVSTLLGTDITRRFGDVVRGAPVQILTNEASIAGGVYRVILLVKR